MTLEKSGIPSCTVVTDVFDGKARREAEALGLEALPLIVLPHPVGQLPREDMERLTGERWDDVLFILTAPREKLTARFVRERR